MNQLHRPMLRRLLFLILLIVPCAHADDLVTRAYHLKYVDASNAIQVLNFAVANPTGKRIFAGSEKHLVVTDTMDQQDAVAELLPIIDQPSKQTDPQRAQMELVVRASRYLQQKKRSSKEMASAKSGASTLPAIAAPNAPTSSIHFTPSVPYKSVYSEEDAKLTAKRRVLHEEPILPSVSALILKGIFMSAKGSPLALLSYQGTNFTARDGGLYERNQLRVIGVTSRVLKDRVILIGPDRVPREIKFASTL